MATRCKFCVNLSIEEVRGMAALPHHDCLADLKSCAETKCCDICLLFWTCLWESNEKEKIDNARDEPVTLSSLIDDLYTGVGRYLEEGGSEIYVLVGERTSVDGHIGIFAEPGTFASKYLLERNTLYQQDSQLRTSLTKHWLSTCQQSHPRCGGVDPLEMPTRVIDVGPPGGVAKSRLFLTKGIHGRYVALSYSWGDGVRHPIKLKDETLESLQTDIPEQSITRAHREAVQITRELGYRYIWIDALCIIQGNKQDWAQEAVKIPQVYGNAELTIVAGRSNHSPDGFLHYTSKLLAPPCRIPYSRPNTIVPEGSHCYISLKRTDKAGPVDKRAWCFQESVLSRRMIVFGMEQLSFKCRERNDYEDGHAGLYEWGKKGRYDLSTDFSTGDGKPSKDVILRRWYDLTRDYSICEIYDPTDVFATLSGVASRFQTALGCRYLAGLWEGDMIRGLLWKSGRLLGFARPTEDLRDPVGVYGNVKGKQFSRAPSWSWLALQGPMWPAKSRSDDRNLQDPSTFRCRPAHPDGHTWSLGHWDTTIVSNFPLPFALEVIGRPQEVSCSTIPISEYYRKPRYRRTAVTLLEAITDLNTRLGNGVQDRIVAEGYFDRAQGNPTTLWAMCLSSEDGILLKKNQDGSFCRLGYFFARNTGWFEQGLERHVTLI
ncbi:heterokaryon incompatibility protein-domain-containing protein [Hypoxylon sp. NC1633]|nr:heterokaryon incompatibility protein-domain-containing protein [Hypoxylon sp. NC1633]